MTKNNKKQPVKAKKKTTGGKAKLYEPKHELEVKNRMHDLLIRMTNGDTLLTRGTLGTPEINLSIDIHTHLAWLAVKVKKEKPSESFAKKYGEIRFDDDL